MMIFIVKGVTESNFIQALQILVAYSDFLRSFIFAIVLNHKWDLIC